MKANSLCNVNTTVSCPLEQQTVCVMSILQSRAHWNSKQFVSCQYYSLVPTGTANSLCHVNTTVSCPLEQQTVCVMSTLQSRAHWNSKSMSRADVSVACPHSSSETLHAIQVHLSLNQEMSSFPIFVVLAGLAQSYNVARCYGKAEKWGQATETSPSDMDFPFQWARDCCIDITHKLFPVPVGTRLLY
ncbi:hypothetical protein BaRGS_00023501 [Batillaria attramentaria]|uniref:Uncharacterized protein n=1 Tax=Batillaria attramentaria TaxID=370345 RepID=A0ABD0KDQ9_9CAEN